MPKENEQNLTDLFKQAENYAMQFLANGREEWDIPHTKAVVYYTQVIAEATDADAPVLVTAAWLHDIGYYGQFNGDSGQLGTVMDKKAKHMIAGAQMAKNFVDRSEIQAILSQEQRDRIVHLVSIHDKLEELTDLDEIILMEADTLGAIDVSRVKPSYDLPNREKYIAGDLSQRRIPRFQTEKGKSLLTDLLPKFIAYRDERDADQAQ